MSGLKQLASSLAVTGKVISQGAFWSTLGRGLLHPPLFVLAIVLPIVGVTISQVSYLGLLLGGAGLAGQIAFALAVLFSLLFFTPLLMRTLCPPIADVVARTMALDVEEAEPPSFARFVGAWILLLLICSLLAIPAFFIPWTYARWIPLPLIALLISAYQVRCSLCAHADRQDIQAVVAETMFYRTLLWFPVSAVPLYLYSKGEKLFKGLFISEYDVDARMLSKVLDVLGLFGGLAVTGIVLALWTALSLHALAEQRQFAALGGRRSPAAAATRAPAAARMRFAPAESGQAQPVQRSTWKRVVLSLCGVLLVGAGAAWSARLVLLNEYLGSTDPDYSADIAYRPDGMNIDEFMGTVFARSACAGRMQRIEKLVRFGVKPGQGNLDEALRCAAANGHAETASYMIRKGADANVFSRELHPGERLPRTALQSAVANKHPDLVELLLANGAQVDLQETGADGRVRPGALHFAAMNKDSAMMATLIRAGARRDAPGPMAPVFYFMEASTTDARTGRAEWSATITAAERAGLSLTGLDADGGNLLHWAASRGESALIELLLERQLDRLRQDKGGAYAFQRLAAWYERRDIEPGPEYDFVLKALAAGVRDINLASRLSQPVVGGSQTESGWTIARAAVAKPRVRAIFGKDVNYAMLDATSSQMGWPFRDQQQAEQLVADLTPAQLAAAITLPTALRSRSWEDLAQLVERKRRF